MNSTDPLFYFLIGLIINGLVTYVAVSSAVQAKRRDKYQSQQINILIKMAQKQGVSTEELDQVLNA